VGARTRGAAPTFYRTPSLALSAIWGKDILDAKCVAGR
jgi:hypothetical protein